MTKKAGIKAFIFDLDGTLYFKNELSWEIWRSAVRYIAELKGLDREAASELLRGTRRSLTSDMGREASLSLACCVLGGDLKELHRYFCLDVVPEKFLERDERVVELLKELKQHFSLIIYTNNNRILADSIMNVLGVSDLFDRVFSIEESWRPKPDQEEIARILDEIGCTPSECLFIGDRYDIDLLTPKEMGAMVCLVSKMEELLALNTYIK